MTETPPSPTPSPTSSPTSGQNGANGTTNGSGKGHDEHLEAPHNLAAEMAVLGAILYDNNAHQRIADIIDSSDFYLDAHQKLFDACTARISAGQVADGVTLHEYFATQGQLSEIGGAEYLNDLIDAAAFGPEIVDYARIIRELSMRRRLTEIGAELRLRAVRPEEDDNADTLLGFAERALFQLGEKGSRGQGFDSFSNAVADAIEMVEAAFKRDGKISGVPTGLDDLDEKLGGLHRSDLVILAGRPSMGKTSLATNIAYNAAARLKREKKADGTSKTVDGAIVGFFSLEMSKEQLATRIIAERTGISSHKMRTGEFQQSDYNKIRDAATDLAQLQLFIDDTGGISISQLAARARRLQRSAGGLDLLIIDYLQLVNASSRKSEGRVQEVSEVTQGLKALAKDLNVPIIALSQLSRAVEQREDKRPQLSDLRESGSIEQDADVVMFVYRHEYYLERTEPSDPNSEAYQKWYQEMSDSQGVAEVIVGKQRHGPIGKVELSFDANVTRFGNRPKMFDQGRDLH